MDDNYDLMPHGEVIKLRKEIKELRNELENSSKPKVDAGDDLVKSMNHLSDSIDKLMQIFEVASVDIRAEDHPTTHEHLGSMNSSLDSLNGKMEQLLKHNEEIAKGILVVAEMMKEHLPAINTNTSPRNYMPRQAPPLRNMPSAPMPPPIFSQTDSDLPTP